MQNRSPRVGRRALLKGTAMLAVAATARAQGQTPAAAPDTRFGQDENTHGRFPGGGATVRFVREAGWGNAMRYMLTGDHWTAEESYRMGVTQQLAPTPAAALEAGIAIARRIAACAPLG